MGRIQLSQPSFANGYARSRGESAAPELWPSHAWVPAFGPQGVATSATGSPLVLDVAGPAGWATGVQKYNVSDIPSYDIGPRGYALKTNGGSNISGLINTGVSPFGGLSAMSFEIILSSATTGVDQIVAEDGTAYNTNAFYFLITSSNKFQFEVYTTSYATVDSALTISAGSVYHVVCTWEGVTGYPKIYINGLLNAVGATAKTGTLQAAPNTPLVLGNRPGALPELVPSFLPLRVGGMIYLARAYKRSLQPDEIARLYTDPYLPHRRRMPVFYSVPSAGGGTYTLYAGSGTIEISGTSAGLFKSSLLSVDAGSVVVTGSASSLLTSKLISAAAGEIEVSGFAADLLKSSALGADAGDVEISGTDAALLKSSLVSAGAGEITITGVDASLFFNRVIQAGSGDIDISGVAADLTYTPTGTTTLSAEGGEMSISGAAVSLLQSHILEADGGAMSITGADALLAISRRLAAEGGSVVVTGSDAAFLISHILSAGVGGVTITGYPATLDYSGEVIPHGVVIITFSAKVPSFSFEMKQPKITIQ